MKRNNSFIFFASYYDAIKNLPEDEQGQFYKAFIEYAIMQKQPKKLTATAKACFLLVKPFLDSSIKRYDANVQNGKKGGRPKKQEQKPNENPNETQTKPNNNPTTNPNETQTKPNPKPKQNLNRNRNRNSNSNINNIKENNNIKEKNNLDNKNVDVVVEKKDIAINVLLNKIVSLQQKYVEQKDMFIYLTKLFERINQETSFVIKNKTYTSQSVLENLINLFNGEDNQIIDRFTNILTMISNATNVSNRFKYSVSVMYHQATNVLDNVNYTPPSKDKFIHNNYTSEQIASLITDLDTAEV